LIAVFNKRRAFNSAKARLRRRFGNERSEFQAKFLCANGVISAIWLLKLFLKVFRGLIRATTSPCRPALTSANATESRSEKVLSLRRRRNACRVEAERKED